MMAQAKRWLRAGKIGTKIRNAGQQPASKDCFFHMHPSFFSVIYVVPCLYLPCWLLWLLFSNSVRELWRNLKDGVFISPLNNEGVCLRLTFVGFIYSLKNNQHMNLWFTHWHLVYWCESHTRLHEWYWLTLH